MPPPTIGAGAPYATSGTEAAPGRGGTANPTAADARRGGRGAETRQSREGGTKPTEAPKGAEHRSEAEGAGRRESPPQHPTEGLLRALVPAIRFKLVL